MAMITAETMEQFRELVDAFVTCVSEWPNDLQKKEIAVRTKKFQSDFQLDIRKMTTLVWCGYLTTGLPVFHLMPARFKNHANCKSWIIDDLRWVTFMGAINRNIDWSAVIRNSLASGLQILASLCPTNWWRSHYLVHRYDQLLMHMHYLLHLETNQGMLEYAKSALFNPDHLSPRTDRSGQSNHHVIHKMVTDRYLNLDQCLPGKMIIESIVSGNMDRIECFLEDQRAESIQSCQSADRISSWGFGARVSHGSLVQIDGVQVMCYCTHLGHWGFVSPEPIEHRESLESYSQYQLNTGEWVCGPSVENELYIIEMSHKSWRPYRPKSARSAEAE